jgi:PAS domain S-box-containing protein
MSTPLIQQHFFRDLGDAAALLRVMEYAPDLMYFIKNARGEIVACNRDFARRMGGETEADVIGKTAFDLCPLGLAEQYTKDDQEVMQSGRDLVNHMELNQGRDGDLNWFLTTKVPLRSRDGRVVGVAGITRDIGKAQQVLAPYDEFQPAVQYVREHLETSISVPELARLAGMSLSRFERRFKRVFGLPPSQYIVRVRVNEACRRLTSGNEAIADIAKAVGFYDQSALARAFTHVMGVSPTAYRKGERRQQKG